MENKPIPDNHPDTISDNSFTTFSSPTGIENMKIEKNNSGVKAPVKKPSSSDAILAALQIKNGASPTSNHKEIMRAVWREVPKYNKDVGMVPVLTGKDVGNLSYIATSIGPTAEGVLRHIISNWIAFTKFVESAKAVKKTPSAPDIGFVVKYVTEAVSFQKQSVQSVAPKSKAGKIASPVKIQTPPAIESKAHEAEEDAEITLDAVMAWEPKPK